MWVCLCVFKELVGKQEEKNKWDELRKMLKNNISKAKLKITLEIIKGRQKWMTFNNLFRDKFENI